MLGVQSDPRSPEHGQYGFLQDLLRRVSYETLAKADRKAKHLAAAAFLEQGWGEHEVVEVVASHYLDAYNTAPDADDGDEIRAKAGELLARAGERAASLGASEEGERYFAQAAELAGDRIRTAELEEQAGRMAWLGAHAGRARAFLDEAHTVFEGEGLKKEAARVSAVLAEIDFREGHPPRAVERLEAALAELEEEDPDEDVATVAAQLGRFLVLNRQLDLAAPHLERALELAEALDLPEVFCQALTSKSVLFTTRNRLQEARILLGGALDRALANDLHWSALRAINNLGVVLESSDEYADAVELIDRGLELARRVGNRVWERNLAGGAVSSLVLLGRWEEALARVSETSDGPAEAVLLTHLATVHSERGDTTRAKTQLDAPILQASEDVQARTALGVAEATILRKEGRLREAIDRAESVLAIGDELGITFLTVKLGLIEALEAAFALGETQKLRELLEKIEVLRPGERPPLLEAHLHRFRGKLAGEGAEFAAATELFRERALTFWLAVTLLEHAELLASQGRTADAEPLLAESREIFEQLEAAPWLARVESTEAGSRAEVPA